MRFGFDAIILLNVKVIFLNFWTRDSRKVHYLIRFILVLFLNCVKHYGRAGEGAVCWILEGARLLQPMVGWGAKSSAELSEFSNLHQSTYSPMLPAIQHQQPLSSGWSCLPPPQSSSQRLNQEEKAADPVHQPMFWRVLSQYLTFDPR